MDDQTTATTRTRMPGSRYINGFLITAMGIHAIMIVVFGSVAAAQPLPGAYTYPAELFRGAQIAASLIYVGVAVILFGYPRAGAVIAGISSAALTPIALVGIAGVRTVWGQTKQQPVQCVRNADETPTKTYRRETQSAFMGAIALVIGSMIMASYEMWVGTGALLGVAIMMLGVTIAASNQPFVSVYSDYLTILISPMDQPLAIRYDAITSIDEKNSIITIHFEGAEKPDHVQLPRKAMREGDVAELLRVLENGGPGQLDESTSSPS